MSRYEATWPGGGHAVITDADGVDAVLGPLHAAGQPVVVDVFRYHEGRPAGGVQVGVGHPQRSFMLYFGQPGGGYAVEPDVTAWVGDIEFSYGGQPTGYHPPETRITTARALQAVRELVVTDQRPTGVDWDENTTDNDGTAGSIDDPWN